MDANGITTSNALSFVQPVTHAAAVCEQSSIGLSLSVDLSVFLFFLSHFVHTSISIMMFLIDSMLTIEQLAYQLMIP